MTRIRTVSAALALGSLLCWADAMHAQAISGTVGGAGAPIVGATVRLLELDRVARTGARGQFTFPDVPAGTYTVFARMGGYASASNRVEVTSGTATTTFDLKESTIALKEVVPSGRTAQSSPSR